jgi:hypothetical protein
MRGVNHFGTASDKVHGCIKPRVGPRTVPVRSAYEQDGVLKRLENLGTVVTAANRDGSRSVELDAALDKVGGKDSNVKL